MVQGSEAVMRDVLANMPAGEWHAEDFLDDDGVLPGPIAIRVTVRNDPARRRAVVDFTGTDPQAPGSLNAVYAITWSAVFYAFRCLLPPGAIATAGLMRSVQVLAPEGSIVNASPPAAVAGGNVETSQRIVDTLLRALAQVLPDRIPAAVPARERLAHDHHFRSPRAVSFAEVASREQRDAQQVEIAGSGYGAG